VSCPYCGEQVNAGFTVCKTCHRDIALVVSLEDANHELEQRVKELEAELAPFRASATPKVEEPVAPPLLLLGKPGVVFAWALPARWRRLLSSSTWRLITGAVDGLSCPLPAAALHGLALWVWHAPAAFDAAVARNGVHALEHGCFFGTALLFWRAVVVAWSRRHVGLAIGGTFATLMHGGLLGGLITMARHPLYAWYRGRTELWSLSALEDQQLAGLLMWVPMGIIYLAASVVLASRLVADSRAVRLHSTQEISHGLSAGRPAALAHRAPGSVEAKMR